MTDFTSEGPARVTKTSSRTSPRPGSTSSRPTRAPGTWGRSSPGPRWRRRTSPASRPCSASPPELGRRDVIQAAIMNHATQQMKDNLLGSPVLGDGDGLWLGRAALSAATATVADPGSLSFGLAHRAGSQTEAQLVRAAQLRRHAAPLRAQGRRPQVLGLRFDPGEDRAVAQRQLVLGHPLRRPAAAREADVWFQLSLDTSTIADAEQEFGWYYFHRTSTATSGSPSPAEALTRTLHVPWHVAPLAASDNGLSESSLDLIGGGSDTG